MGINTRTRLEAAEEISRLVRQDCRNSFSLCRSEDDQRKDDSIYWDSQSKKLEYHYVLPEAWRDPNDPEDEGWRSEEITSMKRLVRIIKDHFERAPLVYVNAYAISRQYGGPEEGSWYYDDYEPLASVPVLRKKDNLEKVEEILMESIGWDQKEETGRDRYSVIGGPDFCIYIETHPGKTRPRPRYE